jgi:hypothetical protein
VSERVVDRLAKVVATQESRRSVLRGVFAVVLGGSALGLARESAGKKKCRKKQKPCHGKCCKRGRKCCDKGPEGEGCCPKRWKCCGGFNCCPPCGRCDGATCILEGSDCNGPLAANASRR